MRQPQSLHEVLQSDDLLGAIFLFLDERSLGRVASVCRAWAAAQASELLWQQLFVARYGEASPDMLRECGGSYREAYKRSDYRWNPLYSGPQFSFHDNGLTARLETGSHYRCATIVHGLNLADEFFIEWQIGPSRDNDRAHIHFGFCSTSINVDDHHWDDALAAIYAWSGRVCGPLQLRVDKADDHQHFGAGAVVGLLVYHGVVASYVNGAFIATCYVGLSGRVVPCMSAWRQGDSVRLLRATHAPLSILPVIPDEVVAFADAFPPQHDITGYSDRSDQRIEACAETTKAARSHRRPPRRPDVETYVLRDNAASAASDARARSRAESSDDDWD